MKIGTVGEFVVIARAFPQATLWGCAFKLRKTETSSQMTTDLYDEVICDEAFELREEAEDFAFEQGRVAAAAQWLERRL